MQKMTQWVLPDVPNPYGMLSIVPCRPTTGQHVFITWTESESSPFFSEQRANVVWRGKVTGTRLTDSDWIEYEVEYLD